MARPCARGCCEGLGVAFLSILTILAAGPAGAITHGFPDTEHTNVGTLILDFEGTGALQWCSGTLVSPRIFLTAGHCTEALDAFRIPLDVVRVSFALNIWADHRTWRPVAGWTTHPEYGWGPTSDPHDVGIVTLAEPATDLVPARLPTPGFLDRLHASGGLRGSTLAVVGYGENEHGVVTGYRQIAFSRVLSLHVAWVYMSQNVRLGLGGTCEGDSGGPTFARLDSVEVLVAVTSWGDVPCVATGINYRIDTAGSLAFIEAMIARDR